MEFMESIDIHGMQHPSQAVQLGCNILVFSYRPAYVEDLLADADIDTSQRYEIFDER